jgi:hypothetical protein
LGIVAGFEAVGLSLILRIKDNQVFWPDLSRPVALSAVVFLGVDTPFVPVGAGNILRLEAVLAVDTP